MASTNYKTDRSENPVEQYIVQHSLRLHPAQDALRQETFKHPLNDMMSGADQMQLIQLLMRSISAKKVVEVGVFTGYGCLSMALALPEDGKVIGCELDDEYIKIAKPYWKQAGVDTKIEIVLAPAKDTLSSLIHGGSAGTFDLAFVDADKPGYDTYYELLLKLIRPNGLIVFDNVLYAGRVLQDPPTENDELTINLRAIQQLNKKLATDERVDISMLSVGDGTTILRKR